MKVKSMFFNIKFSNQSIGNIEFSENKTLFIRNCILSKIFLNVHKLEILLVRIRIQVLFTSQLQVLCAKNYDFPKPVCSNRV